MNSYHVIIDDLMIRNMLQTNLEESLDLVTLKQILYFVFLGLLPSYIIYRVKIKESSLKSAIWTKIKVIIVTILILGANVFLFSKYYTSFVREHKPLRFSINPTYWIFAIGKYTTLTLTSGELIVKPIGLDAKVVKKEKNSYPKLVIMVVGEAARADHFSLNGYKRETNPLLEKENIINYSNVSSCGTSTAESVPCMFSVYDRDDYSYKKGISTQNVLDVLAHTGKIDILWRDNNSDSKGVALRVPFVDYKSAKHNTLVVEGEARDIGMLVGLDKYVKEHKGRDILIILHQMGNHGPAYYKRYTHEYEKFKPTCKTSQLEECSQEEIANAYDNALLYTDNFLAQTINFLKRFDKTRATAMIYMSDHGESLGEKGLYLHGLPYFMAPDAQTHIGAIMWFGQKMRDILDMDMINANKDKKYSQDNLFHTLLGMFEVKTDVYDKKMDILHKTK